MACHNFYENDSFYSKIEALVFSYVRKESNLENPKIVEFFEKILQTFSITPNDFDKSAQESLFKNINSALNSALKKDYIEFEEMAEIYRDHIFEGLKEIFSNPNIDEYLTKKTSIQNQTEALRASFDFVYENLGDSLQTKLFVQDVKKTIFSKIIWDKELNIFYSNISDVERSIKDYVLDTLSTIAGKSITSFKEFKSTPEYVNFLKILEDSKLKLNFAVGNFKEYNMDIDTFKTLYSIVYWDSFLKREFSGFIAVNPSKENTHDFNGNTYSYDVHSAFKFIDNDEFINLDENQEEIVKTFLSNFSIYSPGETEDKDTEIVGASFDTSSWAEAIYLIKEAASVYRDTPLLDVTHNFYKDLTKKYQDSQSDMLLLKSLPEGITLSYFIDRMSDHPSFYLKYFLDCIDIKTLGTKEKLISKTSKEVKENKLNLVYSLYKNLFAKEGSILAAQQNSISHNINAVNYLAFLMLNILTINNIGVEEFMLNDGALEGVDLKNKVYYEKRRALEALINLSNIDCQKKNTKNFDNWLGDLGITAEYKEKNGSKEFINAEGNFTLKFGETEVDFSKNMTVDADLRNALSENSQFKKFVTKVTQIPYERQENIRTIINENPGYFSNLINVLYDVIMANYLKREQQQDDRFKFKKLPEGRYYASVTDGALSHLMGLSIAIAQATNTEKNNVFSDAGKKSISSSTLGNLGGMFNLFLAKCRLNPKSPTSHFSLFSPAANADIRTIRDVRLEDGSQKLWKDLSLPEMFSYSFLGNFIGGLIPSKNYNYSITNGKRIGCSISTNSDKTAFYLGFIDSGAKLFNGKSLYGTITNEVRENAATTQDIQKLIFEEFGDYYKKVIINLFQLYKDDTEKLKIKAKPNSFKLLNPKFKWDKKEVEKLYAGLVDFYKNNKSAIKAYNLSNPRTPIKVINRIHTEVNEELINEIFKYQSETDFKISQKIGNALFAHSLLKSDVNFSLTNLSENDTITSTLKKELGDWKYNLELYSDVPKGEEEKFTRVEITKTLGPYEKGTYFIKKINSSYLEYIPKDKAEPDIKIYTNTATNTYISVSSKYFAKNFGGFNNMPIAVVKYTDKKGYTKIKALTSRIDLEDFASDLENYKLSTAILNNPLILLNKQSTGIIDFLVNPLLEKYNAFAQYMHLEFIMGTVGGNFEHATGDFAPSLSSFATTVLKNFDYSAEELDNYGEIKDPDFAKIIHVAFSDVLSGFCDKTQQKRNVNLTAQLKRLNTEIFNGVTPTMKTACILDIRTKCFSLNGDLGKMKGLDGATFTLYTTMLGINHSLGSAAVGEHTLKLFAALYDEDYGIGSNNKTADFVLSNELIKLDEFYQKMVFNMMKHKWVDENGNEYNPENVFVSSFTGNPILIKETPLYYKKNNKYFLRVFTGIKPGSNPTIYQFEDTECDVFGNTIGKANSIETEIHDNFTLYQALGGWNSCEIKNGKLQGSEASFKLLFEIQTQNAVPKEGVKLKDAYYRHEFFLPLMNSDIQLVTTQGAVKMGISNMNSSDVLFDSIYNEDGSFKDESNYDFYYLDTDCIGPQLDKDHHADRSVIANMTQVMSACVSLGYTPNLALGVYNSLAELSREGTALFRNKDTKEIFSDPASIELALMKVTADYLMRNLNSDDSSILTSLTKEFIKQYAISLDLNIEKFSKKVPISSSQVYKKIYTILGSHLTKVGIKLLVSGTLSVINPTDEIVKYYKIPINLPENFNKDWLNNYSAYLEKFSEVSPKKIYNYLIQNPDIIAENASLEEINKASDSIKFLAVRANKIPGLEFNKSINTSVNYHAFVDNVLSTLSDSIENISDINIGSNYEFTLSLEAYTDFLNSAPNSEKIADLLEVKYNDEKKTYTFWANIGLPYYEIFDGKKHFVGQLLIKALAAKMTGSTDIQIKKIYHKGLDLDFLNVSFLGTSATEKEGKVLNFELTDLLSIQLYGRLSKYKKKEVEARLPIYSELLKYYNLEFIDYFNLYCNNNFNLLSSKNLVESEAEKENKLNDSNNEDDEESTSDSSNVDPETLTVLGQVINALRDLDIIVPDNDNNPVAVKLLSPEIISTVVTNVDALKGIVRDELDKAYKNKGQIVTPENIDTKVNQFLTSFEKICNNFLRKKHQDDLHALSQNSALKDLNPLVVVATNYQDNLPVYTQVNIDKSSIKNKVCGIIMPKRFRTVLGLVGEETVDEILADPKFFTKSLLEKNNCRLHNITVSGDNKLITQNSWELCLKLPNGKHVYIKLLNNNYLIPEGFTDSSYKYLKLKESDGSVYAVDLRTGEVIYLLYDINDKIYTTRSGDDIIITQKATIISSNNKPIDAEPYSKFEQGNKIKNNPFAFYLNTIDFSSYALNTENSDKTSGSFAEVENITQDSIIWKLLDEALSSCAKLENKEGVNSWKSLKQSCVDKKKNFRFDRLIENLEWERDNKGKLNNHLHTSRQLDRKGQEMYRSFNKCLDVIAARIPAQCLQSVMAMRVKDFILSDVNSAMVSIYQFYLQGSDLDIDSVSIQTFSLNEAGYFLTHSPYYDLNLDVQSSNLPFYPLIKSIEFTHTPGAGVKFSEAEKEYIKDLSGTDKKTLVAKQAYEDGILGDIKDDVFKAFNARKEELDKDNAKYDFLMIYYTDEYGNEYQIYHEDGTEVSLVDFAKLYFKNNGELQYLKNLIEAENIWFNKYLGGYCFYVDFDGNLKFSIKTARQMENFCNILRKFKDKPYLYIKTNSKSEKSAEFVRNIISKHFEYYHNLSEKNQFVAAQNNELNNLYYITLDTSHMSESLAAIDSITADPKEISKNTAQAASSWWSTTTNSLCTHLGTIENMSGKDGIAICAVAEKHYFALIGTFQFILELENSKLKNMVLMGLPWLVTDDKGKSEYQENGNFNGKIGNKTIHAISNAFSLRLIKDYYDSETKENYLNFALTTSELEQIDKLIVQIATELQHNPNAALIISALLSLATDNAKELVLGKINAGVETMDLYLVGATLGLDLPTLESIINSSYGQEISELMKSNTFLHKSKLINVLNAVKNFENISKYVKDQFKNVTYSHKYVHSKRHPDAVISTLIGTLLYKKFFPKDFEKYLEYVKKDSEARKDLKPSISDIEKKLKSFRANPIKACKTTIESLIKADPNFYDGSAKKWNYENLEKCNSLLSELYKYLDSLDSPLKEVITSKNLLSYEEFLTNILGTNYNNITTKDFLQKYRYFVPYLQRNKRIFRDIYREAKYVSSQRLWSLMQGEKSDYWGILEEDTTKAKFLSDRVLQEGTASYNPNALPLYYKTLASVELVWGMWLNRLKSCEKKYTNSVKYDFIEGNFDIPSTFNKLALASDEFKRGSRLLINKEIPTDPEEAFNLIGKFENSFIDQLKMYSSIKQFKKLSPELYDWIKKVKSFKDEDAEFKTSYIEFDSSDKNNFIPVTGGKLNLLLFVKDPEYRMKCLELMDSIKYCFNILLPVSTLPHYQAYLETLAIQLNNLNFSSRSLLRRNKFEEIRRKLKITDPAAVESFDKKVPAVLETININDFLKELEGAFSFNMPDGVTSADASLGELTAKVENLDISTPLGKLNFILMIELSIGKLQELYTDNEFVQNLLPKINRYTLNGMPNFPLSIGNINLNPGGKDLEGKIILDKVKTYFKQLSTEDFKEKWLDKTEFKGLQYRKNTQLSIADALFIYMLLTSGNQTSQTSLTGALSKLAEIEGSMAEKYYTFIRSKDAALVDAFSKCRDKAGNIDLTSSGNQEAAQLINEMYKKIEDTLEYLILTVNKQRKGWGILQNVIDSNLDVLVTVDSTGADIDESFGYDEDDENHLVKTRYTDNIKDSVYINSKFTSFAARSSYGFLGGNSNISYVGNLDIKSTTNGLSFKLKDSNLDVINQFLNSENILDTNPIILNLDEFYKTKQGSEDNKKFITQLTDIFCALRLLTGLHEKVQTSNITSTLKAFKRERDLIFDFFNSHQQCITESFLKYLFNKLNNSDLFANPKYLAKDDFEGKQC